MFQACFREEDSRPAVNATRYRNYAWRVKESIGSIDISLLLHTHRRILQSPSTAIFPIGFSVKVKKHTRTPTAQVIDRHVEFAMSAGLESIRFETTPQPPVVRYIERIDLNRFRRNKGVN